MSSSTFTTSTPNSRSRRRPSPAELKSGRYFLEWAARSSLDPVACAAPVALGDDAGVARKRRLDAAGHPRGRELRKHVERVAPSADRTVSQRKRPRTDLAPRFRAGRGAGG